MIRLSRVFAFVTAFASPALGQAPAGPAIADSSPARIMARVGSHADVPWLTNILRPSGATYSQIKLNEIGDSLVARGIDTQAADPRSDAYTRAVAAIDALADAGSGGTEAGRPYAGALACLTAVHQQATKVAIRAYALQNMLSLADRPGAIAYLQEVAESADVTADFAVDALIVDANGSSSAGEKRTPSEQQATSAALNALAARHRVTNLEARRMLEVWIENHRSNGPPK